MNRGLDGSLPMGSLSILTIIFCSFFVMRGCDICFESEWWNVATNALCLTIPLIGTSMVMASYTTLQQKALWCLFLFPIVLLCTATFCIYSPRWTKTLIDPSSVPRAFKVIQHSDVRLVVYKNDSHKMDGEKTMRMEVYEEKDLGVFKSKRFIASNADAENVVITFPDGDNVSCTFKPTDKKYTVSAHGVPGAGLFETLGFRKR
jgi:hypothetical protein